ncbi:MAG: OmpA family protein [Candidatus Aminicenantes bacterium]|nr:OmpA family protein [Candidatus Aminicenantes bacterium]
MNKRCWLAGMLMVLFVATLAGVAAAQEPDAEGCKDHPMFTRMKDFYIDRCESNFDAVEFSTSDSETKTLEGQRTYIYYILQEEAQNPSPLQIRRNYTNAIRALGGTVVYDSNYYVSLRVVKDNREIWVAVDPSGDGRSYGLTILELGEMTQEVTASDMLAALNKSGYVALYINFDTGKATIKPESEKIIDEIASLLHNNPELQLSVEGHTDNVGSPASNKALSVARAEAVLNAVVGKGVDASRLTAVGWGQEKPIAENRSEEGRAKNRRVEIVKK